MIRSTRNYEADDIESRGGDGADVGDDEDGDEDVMAMLSPMPRRSRWS
jgi:hypothetical protein